MRFLEKFKYKIDQIQVSFNSVLNKEPKSSSLILLSVYMQ